LFIDPGGLHDVAKNVVTPRAWACWIVCSSPVRSVAPVEATQPQPGAPSTPRLQSSVQVALSGTNWTRRIDSPIPLFGSKKKSARLEGVVGRSVANGTTKSAAEAPKPSMVCSALAQFTERFTPVPVRLTICGLSAASSVMLSVALSGPVADGVKVTLIEHIFPATTDVPHVFVWAKSAILFPEIEIP